MSLRRESWQRCPKEGAIAKENGTRQWKIFQGKRSGKRKEAMDKGAREEERRDEKRERDAAREGNTGTF